MGMMKAILSAVANEYEIAIGRQLSPTKPYPQELWRIAQKLVETGEAELPNGKKITLKEVTV